MAEDLLKEVEGIQAKVGRKSNTQRKDAPHERFLKEYMRKPIETDFSLIKSKDAAQHSCRYARGFLIESRSVRRCFCL